MQNQQNQGGQGGQRGQRGQGQHRVTKQFTDQKGRQWNVGDTFTGDDTAIQQARQAGNIQESSGQSGQAQSDEADR